jgi:hypothetical protein
LFITIEVEERSMLFVFTAHTLRESRYLFVQYWL